MPNVCVEQQVEILKQATSVGNQKNVWSLPSNVHETNLNRAFGVELKAGHVSPVPS